MDKRLKAYDKYKKTELFWLSEVPEHWQWLYLSQVCKEQKIKNSNENENNVLSLSYGNIIRKKDMDFGLVPKEYSGYQIVSDGNIILRLTDLQNDQRSLRTGLVKERGIITSAYTCLRTDQNPVYIHYLLHSYDTLKIFYGMGGGVRQSIGYNDIRKIRLPIPPRQEQNQIVRYLDSKLSKINKFIKAKKKQIELLKEQKQAIISQAVTKGLDSTAKMKPSGIEWLGDIPEQWEKFKLKKLAISIGDGLHGTPIYSEGGMYYFINGNNLWERKISIDCKTDKVAEQEYLRHKVDLDNNTILISLNGTIGNLSFFNNELIILSKSAGYIRLRRDVQKLFVYYYLQSTYIKQFYELSSGATTINNLSLKTLRNTVILMPSSDEQRKIVCYLEQKTEQIDKIIMSIKKEINLMTEYRTALISNIVTGKIDVSDIKVEDVVEEPKEILKK